MSEYYTLLAAHALPKANIQLWLDASDASTITLTSGAVSNWADKSGNGIDFAQGTATNRPIVQTAEQNGRDVVRFDGVNDYLIHNTSILLKNLAGSTMYLVHRLRSNTATRRDLAVISNNTTSAGRLGMHTSLGTANKYVTTMRTTDGGAAQTTTSTNNSDTNWRLLTASQIYTTANTAIFVNNVADGTNSGVSPSSNTSNTDSARATIGCGIALTMFADIDVAEILIYNVNHSTAQRAQVWNYLKAKWNL